MTAGLLIIVALLVYTYFGYPVVIGALARLAPGRRAPPRDVADSDLPSVSVCLPVYNGAADLPAKVESLLGQDYPADKIEILVYCDGCSDDTEAVARRLAAAPEAGGRIRVFKDDRRLGKPTGLNTLVPAARGDLLLLNDVRQPLSRNAVRALAAALDDPDVGCATGNLLLAGGAGSGFYWRYENWIRNQESRFRGMFGMTGPIGMVRRADLTPLPADVILDDVMVPMRIALGGKRVRFVTEAQAQDTAFENEREFRRKVRTLAGNYQIFARMPALLLPFANPIWFETFSHKLMRLCAPWLLVALALLSVAGTTAPPGADGNFAILLLLGQLGFYGAAAVGRRAGPLGSVARTFVVLNAAAVVGLWRWLTGQQRITWQAGGRAS